MKKKKILIVTSSGGHLFKTYQLKPWWEKHDRLWITKIDPFSKSILSKEKITAGFFPENRNLINLIRNFLLAYKFLNKYKPNYLFSTGAGIAPPFFLLAKIMKIKTIFMETFITIDQQTLSGKIIYHLNLANLFLIQNEKLLKKYPKAKYWGSIL